MSVANNLCFRRLETLNACGRASETTATQESDTLLRWRKHYQARLAYGPIPYKFPGRV